VAEEKRPDDSQELSLEGEVGSGRNAWLEAIKELEGAKPVPKEGQQPSQPAQQPPQPGQKLPKPEASSGESTPAREKEQPTEEMGPAELLEEAIERTSRVARNLEKFASSHPYLIAPNIFRMWEDNLQETQVLLEREREHLENQSHESK